MPDYDEIAKRLTAIAPKYGVDPNDTGKLTQVGLKFAKKYNPESFDPVELNNALLRIRGVEQAPPQDDSFLGNVIPGATRVGESVTRALASTPVALSAIGKGLVAPLVSDDTREQWRQSTLQGLQDTAPLEGEGLVTSVVGGILRTPENIAQVRNVADLAEQGVDVTSIGNRGMTALRSALSSGATVMPASIALKTAAPIATKLGFGAATGAGLGVSTTAAEHGLLSAAQALDPQNAQAYQSQVPGIEDYATQAGVGAAFGLLGARGQIASEARVAAEQARAAEALAARQRADQIAAERAQAATDRRMLEHMPPSWDQVGVDYIRGADVLPDPLDPTGVLPARDAIELNRLRDEEAQAQLDAEEAAAIRERELAANKRDAPQLIPEDVAKVNRIAEAESATRNAELSNAPGDAIRPTSLDEVNDIATRQANTIRTVVANRQLGPELRDNLLNRVKSWRAESLAAIARGEPSLPVPKLDELNIPSERNVQAETASMQQRQAVESDATRPLREANAESDAATLRAEIDNLRAELEAIKSGKSQALKQAEQQAIEADKALAAGEAAVAPDRQMVADADKAIRKAEYEMTGKTSPSAVAMQLPIGKQVEASRSLTPRQLAKRTDTPLARDTTAAVAERPVDTTPVVESPKPVKTPQPESVVAKPEAVVPEAPKAVEPAAKITETPTTTKPEGKANEEVRQETSPQQAAQEGKVLERKFYADDTAAAGYREVTDRVDPKFYEGKELVSLDWIRANDPKGEKRAAKLEKQGNAVTNPRIGRNPTRSGSTSIPSVLADAIANTVKVGGTKLSGLASETLRTIANSVDTLGSWVNTARAFTYAGNKFKLSNADRQHINRIEEEYTGILHDMRGVLAKAIQDTIVGVTEGRIGKALRDAAADPAPGSSASLGNGYESKLKLMIEGKIPLTPELEKPIRAMWAINKATHDAAVAAGLDVGKGYPDGVGLNRHFVDDAFEQLMHYPNSEFSIKLKEELARGNGLSLDQVNKHFEQITNLLSGDSTKIVRYDAQEFSRRFKYFPDKIKTSSGWQQVLDVDPNNYINAVSRSLARRAAANKVMGGKTVDAFVKENNVENVDAFVSTLRDFYGISKTPKADTVLDSSLARGIMTGVNASTQALLSQSHLGNIGEWSMAANIVPPKYIGTMRKVEFGEGGFNFDTRANISDLRGGTHRVNQIIDAGSRMLGSNLVNSFVAKRLFSSAASFYTNSLGDTSGTVRMYGKMGGLSDSLIAKIEDGTATDRDIAVAAATATKHAMGHDLIGSQKAGMENSRIIRAMGPAFRSYSQKTMRLIERGIVTAASIAKDKSISPQKRATLAAAAIVNPITTVAGNAAFYTAYKAALAGSLAATFAEVMDRLENPSAQSTAWILAQTIGGTYAEIGTHLANPDDMTAVQLGSMLSRPFAMAVGLYDAQQKGIDGAIARVPLINNIRKNLEGKGDIGQARSTFFRVRKELGLAGSFKGDPNDQLWKSTGDIVKAIENGEDYKPLLREAYKVAMRENPSDKFSDIENKIADKLISRTTIFKDEDKLEKAAMGDNPVKAKLARDQLRQLRERMAPIKDTLKAYDREIIRIAERIRPPKFAE